MSIIYQAAILDAGAPLAQAQFDSLLTLVSKQKRERILRLHPFQDAQNCLLGDVLARMEICSAAGLGNEQLEFAVNEHGKPYLASHPDFHFNISHSGHYIAFVMDDEPAGIDIERFRPVKDNIAERFFAPDEIAYINAAQGNLRSERFFEIWTKKESYIKREGKGLSVPLPSFSVLGCNDSKVHFFHELCKGSDALCHACTAKETPPQLQSYTVYDMLNILKSEEWCA